MDNQQFITLGISYLPAKYLVFVNPDKPEYRRSYYLHERTLNYRRQLLSLKAQHEKYENTDPARRKKWRLQPVRPEEVHSLMYRFWLIIGNLYAIHSIGYPEKFTTFSDITDHPYCGGEWGRYIEGFTGNLDELLDAAERHLNDYLLTDDMMKAYRQFAANEKA